MLNEPATVVVPVGRVTVPVAIVRLPVNVRVLVEKLHVPPAPVKLRLLNDETPRAMTPVEVPTNETVPFCGTNELLFVQLLYTLIL